MRAHKPGGRFDADFETDSILIGFNEDYQRPTGTQALWYVYDPASSTVDPIYDTAGTDPGVGRYWKGPYVLPVLRAVITQGPVPNSERGFYGGDYLHLTLHGEDLNTIAPGVLGNPDVQNRGRLIWQGQVYRPFKVQQKGSVADRFTLVVVDCIQIMPEEAVNDTQFLAYASPNEGYDAGAYNDDTYGDA